MLLPNKKTIQLVFQSNQVLIQPKDTVLHGKVWKLKNHFFINETTQNQTDQIDSVQVNANIVTIHLKNQLNDGFVSYIPSYVDLPLPDLGSLLTNTRGNRALAFYQLQIDTLIENPVIKEVKTKQLGAFIQFNQKFPVSIRIQKSEENSENFRDIAFITEDTYLDTLRCTRRYSVFYRVQLYIPNFDSIWSEPIIHPCTPVDLLEVKEIIDKPTELYARRIVLSAPVKHTMLLEYTEFLPRHITFGVRPFRVRAAPLCSFIL